MILRVARKIQPTLSWDLNVLFFFEFHCRIYISLTVLDGDVSGIWQINQQVGSDPLATTFWGAPLMPTLSFMVEHLTSYHPETTLKDLECCFLWYVKTKSPVLMLSF